MDEIGYEDCDYISHENSYQFWFRFDDFHGIPMELPLPCRDPVDHLMSQCNHRGLMLNCEMTEERFIGSIKRCLLFLTEDETNIFVFQKRFSMKLVNPEKRGLKCYHFKKQFTTYLDYISEKLQPKRIVSEYKKREVNAYRNITKECIWKRDELVKKAESYLLENVDYYKFCKRCLGSENDITHAQLQH
uniref:Uncharacterized protein n=1 Tax=Ditylum brightwellii TaxID=49249 RepID=A0A7S2EJK9_9STRA|mmetsp:Transcript_33209/g.49494  ORF Transcript_33209/g.49494 Transcript_33209/m.49494 type:complete len:189 (+) Transcript_33209:654-1220(+)